jgi:hypothetical protein
MLLLILEVFGQTELKQQFLTMINFIAKVLESVEVFPLKDISYIHNNDFYTMMMKDSEKNKGNS